VLWLEFCVQESADLTPGLRVLFLGDPPEDGRCFGMTPDQGSECHQRCERRDSPGHHDSSSVASLLTVDRNRGRITGSSTTMIAVPMNPAAIGCVTKIMTLPREIRSDWRIDSSAIRPSTYASTSGIGS